MDLGGPGSVPVSILTTLPGLEPCAVLGFDDLFDLMERGLDGVPPVGSLKLDCDPCVNVATEQLSMLVREAYDTNAPSGVSSSAVCMDGGESSWDR